MNKSHNSFKWLETVFIAVLSMQIFIALILYFLRDMNIAKFDILTFEYLPIVVLILNTTSILFAKYIFTARNNIDKKLSFDEKIVRYKNYSILLIAVLDFVNIINILIFFLSGKQIYLLVALLVLILYIVYRPSKIKFADTTLSSMERSNFIV